LCIGFFDRVIKFNDPVEKRTVIVSDYAARHRSNKRIPNQFSLSPEPSHAHSQTLLNG